MTDVTDQRSRAGFAKVALLAVAAIAGLALGFAGRTGPIPDPSVHLVTIPAHHVELRPVLAQGNPRGETFEQMMARLHPYAAINGTYYTPEMRPLGEIVARGRLINRGGYRNAIAQTTAGTVVLRHCAKKVRFQWHGYRSGVTAGPRLVHLGRVALNPVADGFSSRSLSLIAPRSGVGVSKTGSLLLVTVTRPVTLAEFAGIMQGLGAKEAMNLDGGGACGLYFHGSTLVSPERPMTNVLAVYLSHQH